MLWILLTVVAAPLQVARNASQRGVMQDAGPWGATLVRFLFGLPFSLAMFAVAAVVYPDARPDASARFWFAVSLGALTQVGATACLMVAIQRGGLAVATVLQQASMPLAAVAGWLWLGDALTPAAWCGVGVATVGLATVSWPEQGLGRVSASGALFGLASGAAFAVALNAYREASHALDFEHPIYAAVLALCVAQTLQSIVLGGWLAVRRPETLRATLRAWRASLAAGVFGSAASACWFAALALSPAAAVRAVSVIEAPIAAAVGRRLFKERLTIRQWAGGALTAIGVIVTSLA